MLVAPFVGAWIEIKLGKLTENQYRSLRSSERGLKFKGIVAFFKALRRSVRRSVD